MSWYRRSQLKTITLKTSSQNPFKISNSIPNNPFKVSNFVNQNNPFRISNSVNDPFKVFNFSNRKSPFRVSNVSYRSYYVDARQVKHFKPRGFKSWFENPRNVMICVVVGTGVGVTVYFGNVETIPYTKRKHLLVLGPANGILLLEIAHTEKTSPQMILDL